MDRPSSEPCSSRSWRHTPEDQAAFVESASRTSYILKNNDQLHNALKAVLLAPSKKKGIPNAPPEPTS
jgi:hypothetical protein